MNYRNIQVLENVYWTIEPLLNYGAPGELGRVFLLN